jgi:cell division protein FtsZ
MPIETAFHIADDVLRQAVQGITELITRVGIVNVDFAHIRRLMQQGGGTYLSIGHGQGELKALKAVDQALHHPLLDSIPVENATGIIANFTGGSDLTLFEVSEALSNLQAQTSFNAEIVMGVNQDSQMEGRVQLILVMTGIGAPTLEETLMGAKSMNQPLKSDTHTPKVEETTIAKLEEPPLFPRTGNLASDLDIPAFLRRRMRTANSEE